MERAGNHKRGELRDWQVSKRKQLNILLRLNPDFGEIKVIPFQPGDPVSHGIHTSNSSSITGDRYASNFSTPQ
jgi:hypothetical protein